MATQTEFNQFVMEKLESVDAKLKELEAKQLLLMTMGKHHAELTAFMTRLTPILDKAMETKLDLMLQRHRGEMERAEQVVQMFSSGNIGHA